MIQESFENPTIIIVFDCLAPHIVRYPANDMFIVLSHSYNAGWYIERCEGWGIVDDGLNKWVKIGI